MKDSSIKKSHEWILRSCEQVKKASIEWAVIRAMRDVRNHSVDIDAYSGPDLAEERRAYWKKVRQLDNRSKV